VTDDETTIPKAKLGSRIGTPGREGDTVAPKRLAALLVE
jgi:hypothetical protein